MGVWKYTESEERPSMEKYKLLTTLKLFVDNYGGSDSKLSKFIKAAYTGVKLKEIWTEGETISEYIDKKKLYEHNKIGKVIYYSLKKHGPLFDICFGERKNEEWVEKVTLNGVTFYFTLTSWGGPSKTFYATSKDLTVFRDWFWDSFGPFSTFQVQANLEYRRDSRIDPYPISGSAGHYVGPHTVENLFEYWDLFRQQNFSRSVLFSGPPGTGKTTTALQIANSLGGRLLVLPANMLSNSFSIHELMPFLQILKPNVLLLEDIHTILKFYLSEMLSLMEWIPHGLGKEVIFVATTNNLKNMDSALKRPGRFDEVWHFGIPENKEEILEVLHFYANLFKCESALNWDELADQIAGFSQSHIAELMKSIKALKDDERLHKYLDRRIESMRELLGLNEEEEEEDEEDESGDGEKETKKLAEKG